MKVEVKDNAKYPKNINLTFLYSRQTIVSPWGVETKYSVLGGFLTYKKDDLSVQRLRLCGVVLYSKKIKNGFMVTRIMWIPVYKQNLKKELAQKIIQHLDDNYDDIYVIRHNIGETYIYLTHLNNWIKKNGSKKPLLLVWQKKDIPLYKMFLNENVQLQYFDISQRELQAKFVDECIKYNGKRIFCPTPNIVFNIIKKREEIPNWTFYNHICKDFILDFPDKLTQPLVSHETKDIIQRKIKKNFRRPFVVVIPNANSLQAMPADFWNKIIDKLNRYGYDVFINNHRTRIDNRDGIDVSKTVTFDCNLAEMYELTKCSDGVITLASGLAVLLTATGKKMDLIYTDTNLINGKNILAVLMQSMYSVYNLPGINKKAIKEHNANMYSIDELTSIILARYNKNHKRV